MRQAEARESLDEAIRLSLETIVDPGCLMAAVFQETAQRQLAELPGVSEVDVRVDHGHVWDPQQLEPTYQGRLTRIRAQRLQHKRGGAARPPRGARGRATSRMLRIPPTSSPRTCARCSKSGRLSRRTSSGSRWAA